MLYRPISDYKNIVTQTLTPKRVEQGIFSSSEQRDVPERNEKRLTVSVWGTTATTTHHCANLTATGLSRATSPSGSEKRVAHENEHELSAQPFITKYGRQYLRDLTSSYPLPCDLVEIHRQTLRTILLCEVFKGPLCSPFFEQKPPKRVLEVACGTGFWSEMCHRHFSQRGHTSISFTGIDIAFMGDLEHHSKHSSMNWRFVQHDLRRLPLPFTDGEFSLVMIKDLSLVTSTTDMQQNLMSEYMRILKPGGIIEIWDGDHSLRLLLPPTNPAMNELNVEAPDTGDSTRIPREVYEIPTVSQLLTQQSIFTAPKDPYVKDYNMWISQVLGARKLAMMPCSGMLSTLLQESETLQEIDCRQVAIPLGEAWWEKNIDSKSKYNYKGKKKPSDRKSLNASQSAIRKIALNIFTQMVQSLEPLLQEASGKEQEEWDIWMDGFMSNLLLGNGASRGECLEIGAWWAKKKATF